MGVQEVDQEKVAMLTSMGFAKPQAERALRNTDGDVERAMDWVLSHGDEPDEDEAKPGAEAPPKEAAVDDGPGRYELLSFITHIGKQTASGHYVCHIKKDGEWAFFNDSKVTKCEDPPFKHGYMFIYRRKD